MKQRRTTWILGTIVTASLAIAAPAHAATKNGAARIPAAKIDRVTQITNRDVVLSRNPAARTFRDIRTAGTEFGRVVVLPNPDAQRVVVLPNPDAQRVVVLPNPDAQ